MNHLRAFWRRLDAWSALLLGVLVTLGVIILFAAPGPWHRVAPGATPQPPLAPPAPPNDVAVLVRQGKSSAHCAGVIWLHVAYDLPRFTAVVVPAGLTCLQPGAGFQPLGQIADEAGPAVAAAALGDAVGVTMDAWITVDPRDLRAAVPGFLKREAHPEHPRPLALAGAWRVDRPVAESLQQQAQLLRRLTASWGGVELNLVGFVNYVLGSTHVDTSMKLQAVSSIGEALQDATPTDFSIGTLPATVVRRGAYRRCLPLPMPLLALRSAFAVDASSPVYPPTILHQRAGDRMLVLTSPLSPAQRTAYRTAFAHALAGYGAGPVRVELRPCRRPADVLAAFGRPTARPWLGAVLAFGATATGSVSPDTATALLTTAIARVGAASLPAVVSEAPIRGPAAAGLDKALRSQASAAGLPVSPVAPGQTATTATIDGVSAAAWARANAATFARAAQPRYFAPSLAATRLGISYYDRMRTKVGVVSESPSASALVTRLSAMGYAAAAADDPGLPHESWTTVYYGSGERRAALGLAGDLGLSVAQTAEVANAPQGLTLVTP